MLLVCNCFYADTIRIFPTVTTYSVVGRGCGMLKFNNFLYYNIEWCIALLAGDTHTAHTVSHITQFKIIQCTSRVNLKKKNAIFKHFIWRAIFLKRFFFLRDAAERLFLVTVIYIYTLFPFQFELLYFWSVNQSSLIQRF